MKNEVQHTTGKLQHTTGKQFTTTVRCQNSVDTTNDSSSSVVSAFALYARGPWIDSHHGRRFVLKHYLGLWCGLSKYRATVPGCPPDSKC